MTLQERLDAMFDDDPMPRLGKEEIPTPQQFWGKCPCEKTYGVDCGGTGLRCGKWTKKES